MNTLMKKTLHSSALIVAVAASAFVDAEVVSSTVELEDIQHLRIGGHFNVTVTQGEPEFVRVTTEEKNLDRLEVKVRGDTLRIDSKYVSGLWSIGNDLQADFEVQVRDIKSIENRDSGDLKVSAIISDGRLTIENRGSGDLKMDSIQARKLELNSRGSGDARVKSIDAGDIEISSRGSGNVDVDLLNADELEVGVYGSSDIKIGSDNESRSKDLDITIRGSGDVNAQDLVADYAEVSIYGSGDVRVNVKERLEVDISGSGDVLYIGSPAEIDQNIKGSGDVRSIK